MKDTPMESIRTLLGRLRVLFRRDSVIEQIDEEMRLHIDLETEHCIARGMSPDAARQHALGTFGNAAAMKDIGFQYSGGMVMDYAWQDLKYGVRMLLKNPVSTVAALLTLAIG